MGILKLLDEVYTDIHHDHLTHYGYKYTKANPSGSKNYVHKDGTSFLVYQNGSWAKFGKNGNIIKSGNSHLDLWHCLKDDK